MNSSGMTEENKIQKFEPATRNKYRSIIELVIDGLPSENSRRAYERHLEELFAWHHDQGQPELNKALINNYLRHLREERKLSSANINQKLSAIRKLASEAEDNNLLEYRIANGIRAIKGVTHTKNRLGNWLTQEEAQIWINTPDIKTLKGLRDRALLAVLLGCGLRRSETANLTFAHLQKRENRWVIVNLIGKRDKMRSVPMAGWVKKGIDDWATTAGLLTGNVFRKVHKSNQPSGESITPQAIYKIIKEYAEKLDQEKKIAPHDLRRTFAHLSYEGGSEIDQVQLSLGHNSIQTTENYLGIKQKLKDAPSDLVGLKLE
jgi:site-specific recombinase XerD